MALCFFFFFFFFLFFLHCGHLTGEIGNWSHKRRRTNGSLFVSLWSSHWGNRKLVPWATQNQWLSVCFSVVISLGKKETSPVSDTGPMALCLFQCGHLTGEIGNWSRERHRTNGYLFVSVWSSHWGKRKLVPWAIQDQWLSVCFSVVISLGK